MKDPSGGVPMGRKPGPVGAVILAAGASTRLGMPKQLLRYRGRSLLEHAVLAAVRGGCRPVLVVIGAEAERIRRALALPPGVQWIENPHWAEGMSTSIRRGLEALVGVEPAVVGAVWMVCDQPYVSASLVRRMLTAYRQTGVPVVACRYAGTLGVPALLDRSLFPGLYALEGDRGAQAVLARHVGRAVEIPFPGGAFDVDTPEDWARLQDRRKRQSSRR